MAVEEHQDVSTLADPAFWVSMGFLGFILLAAKYVWPKLTASLDAHTNKVKSELDQAKQLKEEAEAILAAAKRKAGEAENLATEILERAKFEAKQIAHDSEKEIEKEIDRKMKLAEAKIKRAEETALENVRKQAIDIAVKTAGEILAKESGKAAEKTLASSLTVISNSIN